jgi:bla regulator protein BlaR1
METSILNQWFSGHRINAICWTLIHSLWIGLIIALLCGIIVATTRKSTAALRYRLLCGLLVLFVGAMGVTYYLEANSAPAYKAVGNTQNISVNAAPDVVVNRMIIHQNQTFFGNVQAFLNQNVNIIFLVWLLFFVLKSLKMVSGLLYIQRIRHYKTSAVTEQLKHRIEYLSSQIGIRRAVRLVQSELVKVPVAVGWLKPMILLPVGIAFQLTPEQLDGILWHELAHIRRRDYLVNILQGLVETVFFFNPGLLWLSSLIRTEREACCDDMVLSRMNRKANYLEALLSFGYGEFSQARYAMSIGSGNQLRDRLKRMISQENKRLSVAEKSVLAVGLVLLTAFTTVSKDNPIIRHLTIKYSNKSERAITKTVTDTTAVSIRQLSADQLVSDSKPGQHREDSLRVTDTALRFKSVLFKHSDADLANNDISAKDDKGNIYHFIVVDGKIASMELNSVKIAESKLPDYEYTLQLIISELMEKRRVRSEDIAGYKAKNPVAKFKSKDSVGYAGKRYGIEGRSSDKVWAKMDEKQPHADVHVAGEWARDTKTESMRRRLQDDSISYGAQLQRAQNVIADLVKDKVVPDAASVKWFGLSNTEFIVNGQKQPDEMQQRYKAKYGIYDGYGLYYGPVQMHGKGVFIDASVKLDRPAQPERPRPKYTGSVRPNVSDSAAWKLQQLIKQQSLFAADQSKKRQKITQEQQVFAAKQDAKRQEIIRQQQLLMVEQYMKRKDILKQQQLSLTDEGHDAKFGIDLKTPIFGIIADLVSANVISDKSDLVKFNLTNSTLMVNGKKQPEELHERLKLKYLEQPDYALKFGVTEDPNFGLHFNVQNGNMGLGITNGPDSP